MKIHPGENFEESGAIPPDLIKLPQTRQEQLAGDLAPYVAEVKALQQELHLVDSAKSWRELNREATVLKTKIETALKKKSFSHDPLLFADMIALERQLNDLIMTLDRRRAA
jgi:hypothetical protein